MSWTVDHTLTYKLCSYRRNCRHKGVVHASYVAGTMRAGSDLSHCSHVTLFDGRHAIEPHAEKALVKAANGLAFCLNHITPPYGRLSCYVPSHRSPLLWEIWVSISDLVDLVQSRIFE